MLMASRGRKKEGEGGGFVAGPFWGGMGGFMRLDVVGGLGSLCQDEYYVVSAY